MLRKDEKDTNQTSQEILLHSLLAAVSLFVNGFGVYLTIHVNIGVGPWDVLNLGLSKTFGILYGTASIAVSLAILCIDIGMKEAVGIAMFIDAFVVGKAVDFFDYIDVIPTAKSILGSLVMCVVGLFIMGYTQCFYMKAALGCGPRDTLLVGLNRRMRKVPIGLISIVLLSVVTLVGYLLGGPVGIGTLVCAFLSGPIMQFAFFTVRFKAVEIRHQTLKESVEVIRRKEPSVT